MWRVAFCLTDQSFSFEIKHKRYSKHAIQFCPISFLPLCRWGTVNCRESVHVYNSSWRDNRDSSVILTAEDGCFCLTSVLLSNVCLEQREALQSVFTSAARSWIRTNCSIFLERKKVTSESQGNACDPRLDEYLSDTQQPAKKLRTSPFLLWDALMMFHGVVDFIPF